MNVTNNAWPAGYTLEWIYQDDERLTPFIIGYLEDIIKKTKCPTVVCYLKDWDKPVDAENIVIIHSFEHSLTKRPHYICDMCKAFRDHVFDGNGNFGHMICNESFKKTATQFILAAQNGTLDIEFGKTEEHYMNQHCYKSKCSPFNLTQLVLPIVVANKTVGCFMTGQYGVPNPSDKYMQKWYDDWLAKKKKEVKSFEGHGTFPEPNQDLIRTYIERSIEINALINKERNNRKLEYVNAVRHKLLKIIRGVGVAKDNIASGIEKDNGKGWYIIEDHIKKIDRLFCEAMWQFKQSFVLNKLIKFHTKYDEDNRYLINGLGINEKEDCDCDLYDYKLDSNLLRRYIGKRNSPELETLFIFSNLINGEDDIRDMGYMLKQSDDIKHINLKKSALLVFNMQGFKNSPPIVCLLEGERLHKVIGDPNSPMSPAAVFEEICMVYMAQRNALLAEKNHRMAKANIQYYDHEIGLASAMLNNLNGGLRKRLQYALGYRR